MRLLTEDQREITAGRRLGAGAEGTVYEAGPAEAAKIWHPGPENGLRAEKIVAMIGAPPTRRDSSQDPRPQDTSVPRAAWPTALLMDENATATGFLMPLLPAERHRSIFHHFNAQARSRAGIRNDERDILRVARNLAHAAAEIHTAGHVIGDVNEMNTLVSNALAVTLVDADSMQVKAPANGRIYRCTKGRDDYTPPRLQSGNFADRDRTQEDDAFGLAVLIFKLQMDGVHPFASTSDPERNQSISLADKIRREYFPYNESGHTPEEHQPSRPYREAWQDLDFRLRHLFRRAFDPQATASEPRPDANEWATELNRLIRNPPKRRRPEVQTTPPKQDPAPQRPPPGRAPASTGAGAGAATGPGAPPGPRRQTAGVPGATAGVTTAPGPAFQRQPPTMASGGSQHLQNRPQRTKPATAKGLLIYAGMGFAAMAGVLLPIFIFAGPGF